LHTSNDLPFYWAKIRNLKVFDHLQAVTRHDYFIYRSGQCQAACKNKTRVIFKITAFDRKAFYPFFEAILVVSHKQHKRFVKNTATLRKK